MDKSFLLLSIKTDSPFIKHHPTRQLPKKFSRGNLKVYKSFKIGNLKIHKNFKIKCTITITHTVHRDKQEIVRDTYQRMGSVCPVYYVITITDHISHHIEIRLTMEFFSHFWNSNFLLVISRLRSIHIYFNIAFTVFSFDLHALLKDAYYNGYIRGIYIVFRVYIGCTK